MRSRWQRLTDLFEAALEVPESKREAWLVTSCDSLSLRAEVLQMLEAHGDTTGILDQPANEYAADLLKSDVDDIESVGIVGRYRLIEEIASGGMGKVYLAERSDGQFERKVAVKILRSALSASHLERRFLAERQILASLDHPNVARILDGGVTDSGAPYFAMEFVEGVPITRFCDENKLSIRERLQLFLDVCSAVAHAHQRLVVHRDLKPSNIFVRPDGQVKLLDFGIAKVLESDLVPGGELHTITGLHLMTPEYASPEQVRGEPISIASDVYQLGILLYELLVGQRPYELRSHSLTAIASAVLESEPKRPGTIIRLANDLDAITLKALRKEPNARYPSVDHLAADIRRFLHGEAVEAHKGSVGYRVGKFLRRYRWAVGAAVVFVAMLVGYAATVTVQQARTAHERDRAERYAEFVTDLFASPDPFANQARIDQRDITVLEFLAQAERRVRTELQYDDELRRELFMTLGSVYDNLGASDRALMLFTDALELSERLFGRESAESFEALRMLAWLADDNETSDSLYAILLELGPKVESGGGPITGQMLIQYGQHLHEVGRFEEADSILSAAENPAHWPAPDHAGPPAGGPLFRSRTQVVLQNLELADSLAQLAVDRRLKETGPDHPQTAVALHNQATVAEARGDTERAESIKRHVLEIWTTALGPEHPYTIAALGNLAVTITAKREEAEADSLMRLLVERTRTAFGDSSMKAGEALQNMGATLLKFGRVEEAEPHISEAYHIFKDRSPDSYVTAYPLLSLTEIYLKQGRFNQAEQFARRACEHFKKTLPEGHPLYAVAQSRRGAALLGLDRRSEAETELIHALSILDKATGYERYRDQANEWALQLEVKP